MDARTSKHGNNARSCRKNVAHGDPVGRTGKTIVMRIIPRIREGRMSCKRPLVEGAGRDVPAGRKAYSPLVSLPLRPAG